MNTRIFGTSVKVLTDTGAEACGSSQMNGGPKSEGCETPPNGYNGPTKPEVAVPGEPNTPTDGMGPIQSSNLKTNHGGDSQTRAANLGATVTAAFSVPAEECKNESAKGAEPNGDNGPPKPEIAVTDRAPEANSFNPTEKVTIEDDVENDGEELPDEIPGRVDEPNEEPVGNFKVSLEGSVLNDKKKKSGSTNCSRNTTRSSITVHPQYTPRRHHTHGNRAHRALREQRHTPRAH